MTSLLYQADVCSVNPFVHFLARFERGIGQPTIADINRSKSQGQIFDRNQLFQEPKTPVLEYLLTLRNCIRQFRNSCYHRGHKEANTGIEEASVQILDTLELHTQSGRVIIHLLYRYGG